MPLCPLTRSFHAPQCLPRGHLAQHLQETLHNCSGILQQKAYRALQSKVNHSGPPRCTSSGTEVTLYPHHTHAQVPFFIALCREGWGLPAEIIRESNFLGLPWQVIFNWHTEQLAVVDSQTEHALFSRGRGQEHFHCPHVTPWSHLSWSQWLSHRDQSKMTRLEVWDPPGKASLLERQWRNSGSSLF